MKKIIKYIVVFSVIILVVVGILIFINKNKTNDKNTNAKIQNYTETKTEEDALVVAIKKKQEEVKKQDEKPNDEPKEQEKPKIDEAISTEEIYSLNMVIGTLYIPKTKLNIEVYSNPDTSIMEKMPAFLYTSGGLNKKGVTLFVGHNRRNGKIFSNNKKLNEGDEFYFKDYKGTELKYTIYSKFITTSDDVSFLNDSVDCPTIALSCCTDASDDNRIIILGKAQT